MTVRNNKYIFPCIIFVLMAFFLIISVIDIKDTMLTWILESFPVVIALIILPLTVKRFRLTNLLYSLIFIHSLVLVYGAHYSYSEVPLGFWLSNIFGWKRNNYDKIGHLMQGFCPVMIAREIISRCTPLKRGGWLAFLSWCVAMTVSALYEIFEWLASEMSPGGTHSFLGTQGYIYDTQSDMGCCAVGAALALLILTHLHNRQLTNLEKQEKEDINENTINNNNDNNLV
ncbi:membrane protein [Anaeromyces robustus]|uniref:Membrane protein n=1 Tax=Anaeromyces robustus TaxID=1754192 RepID=A0A1Y1WWB7_9FUNG|nr:membrane protein [Anaeromyces robustus]|eukprot:ORX77851.1 membrane protein [Anaeromyces robustus]